MDTVLILANGVWEDAAQACRLAQDADLVIAADGGFAKALAAGARVDLLIGDLDSLDEAARDALLNSPVNVRRHPAAKDWSDLELALDEGLARRPGRILILGGLGRRIDHTLTNLHLLERGLDAGVPIELVDGAQSIVLVAGRSEITDAEVGDRISLIPVSEDVHASTNGLRFPLRNDVLHRAASRGLSNVVDRRPVVVEVAAGRLLVIHDRCGASR